MNPQVIRTMVAGGAIGANLIVKPHATEGQTVQAAATTDLAWGVCIQPGGAASGERVDVVMSGITDVFAGGSVAMGALVTSDAAGKAVTLAPGAGVTGRAVGVAIDSAASGDLFRIMVAPSALKG